MNDVRFSRKLISTASKASVSALKKPVQSQSQMTLASLQAAFVRVLLERGYEKMTIREVASVAGVGIGTF
jgi:AcrR family transcriptional regulator